MSEVPLYRSVVGVLPLPTVSELLSYSLLLLPALWSFQAQSSCGWGQGISARHQIGYIAQLKASSRKFWMCFGKSLRVLECSGVSWHCLRFKV